MGCRGVSSSLHPPCFGIPWGSLSSQTRDSQLGAGDTKRRKAVLCAAFSLLLPCWGRHSPQGQPGEQGGSLVCPPAHPARASHAPARLPPSLQMNKGLSDGSKPLQRVGIQPTAPAPIQGMLQAATSCVNHILHPSPAVTVGQRSNQHHLES